MSKLNLSDLQLMWVLGDHTRGIRPGSFYQAMFEAGLKADEWNLRKIGLGFPEIARSIETWRSSPDGWGVAGAGTRPIVEGDWAALFARVLRKLRAENDPDALAFTNVVAAMNLHMPSDPEQGRENAKAARHADRVRLALAVCEGVADDRLNGRALSRLMQMIFEDPSQPIRNASHVVMIRPRTSSRLPGSDDTLNDSGPDPEMT